MLEHKHERLRRISRPLASQSPVSPCSSSCSPPQLSFLSISVLHMLCVLLLAHITRKHTCECCKQLQPHTICHTRFTTKPANAKQIPPSSHKHTHTHKSARTDAHTHPDGTSLTLQSLPSNCLGRRGVLCEEEGVWHGSNVECTGMDEVKRRQYAVPQHRPKYRRGRREKAVRMYTICDESVYGS